MWSMFSTLQLIMLILKYNLIVPGNTYLFFKNVEDFLGMKAEFIDDLLAQLQQKIFSTSDQEDEDGIIRKLGTYFIIAVALISIMIIIGILSLLSNRIVQLVRVNCSLLSFFCQIYSKLRLLAIQKQY
jgi:hypothetical protein